MQQAQLYDSIFFFFMRYGKLVIDSNLLDFIV